MIGSASVIRKHKRFSSNKRSSSNNRNNRNNSGPPLKFRFLLPQRRLWFARSSRCSHSVLPKQRPNPGAAVSEVQSGTGTGKGTVTVNRLAQPCRARPPRSNRNRNRNRNVSSSVRRKHRSSNNFRSSRNRRAYSRRCQSRNHRSRHPRPVLKTKARNARVPKAPAAVVVIVSATNRSVD